jgi:DNA primase
MKTHLKNSVSNRDIKEANSKLLERIVEETIKLEKIKNGYIGICPFCEKRTFYIRTEKNKYHCLNCNKEGGSIEIAMALYHLDFEEAVEYLNNNYYL